MILIPKIKNVDPVSIAEMICSVQPMISEAGDLYKMRVTSDYVPPKEGAIRHSFFDGWQRFYGGEWISTTIWWKIKISGY